jgi:hypothetical protein
LAILRNFSLALTGERISFPTLEAALDFLVESTKEGRKELPIPPDEPGRGIKDG